ncbi:DASH complex subunit Dam1p [Monosporozyma servazzii]
MGTINKERSSTGTGYKLAANSNPGSRRSSLGGVGNDIYLSGTASMTTTSRASINDQENESNLLHKYVGPQISDLHDSVITLEGNFERLNSIHNNLVDLNESFGSLLYGLICTSSCLQFPGLPNNISDQISTINELKQLDKEKQSLLQEISNIKASSQNRNSSVNQNPSNPNTSGNKFSKPLFAASDTRRRKPNPTTLRASRASNTSNKRDFNGNVRNTSLNGQFDHSEIDDMDNEDDNSSEASFVLNPADSQQEPSGNGNVDRRYRRKSILNVIRNSSGPDNYSQLTHSHRWDARNANTASRYSLGGRARRVTHGSTLMSAPSANNQPRTGSAVNRISKTGTVAKPKSVAKRPPFR